MLRVQVPRDGRMRRVLLAFGLFALVEFATWIAILPVPYDRGRQAVGGLPTIPKPVPALLPCPGPRIRARRGSAGAVDCGALGSALWSLCWGGRLGGWPALAVLIGFMQKKGKVWFARLEDIASHVRSLIADGKWQPRTPPPPAQTAPPAQTRGAHPHPPPAAGRTSLPAATRLSTSPRCSRQRAGQRAGIGSCSWCPRGG